MSDFFGKLKSGAGKVAFEAEKMAKANKAQGELGQLKRQIEAHYMKLGDLYYHHFINQAADAPDYGEICQQISGLEQQVGLKAEELQHINAETYGTPAAAVPIEMVPPAPVHVQAAPEPIAAEEAPLTKVCPTCSREMDVNVKFCPDCGTKM